MPPVIPACLIERKREGGTLAPDEIDAFFRGYLQGEVTDYQMSAFLMAVFLRGLGPAELDALVGRMVESGATLDLSRLSGPKVDKHSTGGVGDKVSLVLAPLAAELEMRVPMMAGRGLGQTRRDPRQARGHPGVSHRSLPGPPGRSHRGGGLRRDRVDGRDRAPRPPSLRASQCHRDGAGPASDRFEHHEQEACGRARCPGTGREGGGESVPLPGGTLARAGRHDGLFWGSPRPAHRGIADGDGPPARPGGQQRA